MADPSRAPTPPELYENTDLDIARLVHALAGRAGSRSCCARRFLCYPRTCPVQTRPGRACFSIHANARRVEQGPGSQRASRSSLLPTRRRSGGARATLLATTTPRLPGPPSRSRHPVDSLAAARRIAGGCPTRSARIGIAASSRRPTLECCKAGHASRAVRWDSSTTRRRVVFLISERAENRATALAAHHDIRAANCAGSESHDHTPPGQRRGTSRTSGERSRPTLSQPQAGAGAEEKDLTRPPSVASTGNHPTGD